MKLFVSLIVIVSLFVSSVGKAQDNLLTVNKAIVYAIEYNPELNQMRSQLEKAKNQWRLETGIASPEITYFKEGIDTDPSTPFAEKRIAITQEIDFPLTTAYRLKGLKEEAKAKQLIIESKEKDIKAEVKQKYIEVLYAIHLQKSLNKQLELTQELYNAVYTKYESGVGNGIDLTNAELQVEQVRNDLDQAEWILHQARYGLFYVMGLPAEDQKYTIEFSDTLYADSVNISQILALSVQEKQPGYQAVRHRLNAGNYYIKEAKSSILPDLNLSLYKQDYGDGYNYNGFEVGLKIPLWIPFDQRGKIKIAEASQNEIRWQQNGIKLNMKKQIEYAWHNYSVSKRIVDRYNNSLKMKSEDLLQMSLKAYQLGETDLLILLNAQKSYLESERRYISALRDYYSQLVLLEKFLEKDLVY